MGDGRRQPQVARAETPAGGVIELERAERMPACASDALGERRRRRAPAASSASASGADHTIEMRRPGSGSHASTLPSARNHWRAQPRCGRSQAKFATTAVCPYGARRGDDARGLPHPRANAVRADDELRLDRRARRRARAWRCPAATREPTRTPPGARTSTPAPRTSRTSAARSARSSTIQASARSPRSYAENVSTRARVAFDAHRFDRRERDRAAALPRAERARNAALPGTDRVDARIPRRAIARPARRRATRSASATRSPVPRERGREREARQPGAGDQHVEAASSG